MAAQRGGHLRVSLLENMELIKFPPRVISQHIHVRDPSNAAPAKQITFLFANEGPVPRGGRAWGGQGMLPVKGASCPLPIWSKQSDPRSCLCCSSLGHLLLPSSMSLIKCAYLRHL